MCTIAVDFDGTISADFQAARKALSTLIEKGHTIVIWSSRNNHKQHGARTEVLMQYMQDLLDINQVPYHAIDTGDCGKFHAQVYIDDKSWRFENNWEEIITRIY